MDVPSSVFVVKATVGVVLVFQTIPLAVSEALVVMVCPPELAAFSVIEFTATVVETIGASSRTALVLPITYQLLPVVKPLLAVMVLGSVPAALLKLVIVYVVGVEPVLPISQVPFIVKEAPSFPLFH